MTREQALRVWPCVKAYGEGKTVQVAVVTTPSTEPEKWVDLENPAFTDSSPYRIKPEPREYWAVAGLLFNSHTAATEAANRYRQTPTVIHLKEVQ